MAVRESTTRLGEIGTNEMPTAASPRLMTVARSKSGV
jgi:hypothetical protein